jgi:hypothetical protein
LFFNNFPPPKLTTLEGFAKKKMASSSVSQEDVEKDFQLLSRRSKIRTARARNPLSFSQRPGKFILSLISCFKYDLMYAFALQMRWRLKTEKKVPNQLARPRNAEQSEQKGECQTAKLIS